MQGIVMGAAQMLTHGFNNRTNLQDRNSAPAKRHGLPNRLQTSNYGARKVLSTTSNSTVPAKATPSAKGHDGTSAMTELQNAAYRDVQGFHKTPTTEVTAKLFPTGQHVVTPHPHIVANLPAQQQDLAEGGPKLATVFNVADGPHAKAQFGGQLLGCEQATIEDNGG
ncbi:MAG: hypothetical protein FRX49_03591 [Trebouxia sp. A1-2]|nr:MAG: hypothetical protein FRX49_03591 [Trebouxia sp. A1-2]